MSFHSGLSGYLDTHHGQIDSIPSEGSPPKGGWFAVGEKKIGSLFVGFCKEATNRGQHQDSSTWLSSLAPALASCHDSKELQS